MTPDRALADGDFDEAVDHEAVDDEFVPHHSGAGVYRERHFRDAETGALCVRVQMLCGCRCREAFEETVGLEAGEGVAIGQQPCEIHVGMEY